jgi:hypothetical protein
MARISIELLNQEFKNWLKLKEAINKTLNGKVQSFGKFMVNKYNLDDKYLEKQDDHNMALLHIVKKHVYKKGDKL